MKLTIGWPSIRPNAPSWKTATVAPRVASTERRKPKVAVSGTRSERKTSISSMNARPMTIAR